MRIPFREWLLQKSIDETSRALFDEAFLCYQTGAYRACLVFSYLGLLRILAYRLRSAERPNEIPEALWRSLQTDLAKDDKWESAVFDAVQRRRPAQIFLVADEVREQLAYWRQRRNDAAHARRNLLSHAHIEALWLFIQSNLQRIVVEGGRAALLERFRRHFDITLPPQEGGLERLVAEIPEALTPEEHEQFFDEVIEITDIIKELEDVWSEQKTLRSLVTSIAELGDAQVRSSFFSSIKRKPRLLVRLLHVDPRLVLEYRDDAVLLRNLWHDSLPFGIAYHGDHTYLRDSSLRVVAAMLRLQLIPESAREYAMDHVLAKVFDEEMGGYSGDVIEELEMSGLFEAIYRRAFLSTDKSWAMNNVYLVREYILRRPIDNYVAHTVAEIAGRIGLEEASSLLYFFERHPEVFEEIQSKLGANKIDLDRLARQSGYEFWEEEEKESGGND